MTKAPKKPLAKKPATKRAATKKTTAKTAAPKTQKKAPEKETFSGPVIDPKLLGILVCPKTRSALTYDREAGELISKKAKLAYPVRDGVPIMLVDEARKL